MKHSVYYKIIKILFYDIFCRFFRDYLDEGVVYSVAMATVLFSPVKISHFRPKAHLVFDWCSYSKGC